MNEIASLRKTLMSEYLFYDISISCRFGVRCNAVLPGFIKTPMTDAVPEKELMKVSCFIPTG